MREEPEPQPTDPKDEPQRPTKAPTFAEFMERTRRIHKLTRKRFQLHYARGLDTKPEDMA